MCQKSSPDHPQSRPPPPDTAAVLPGGRLGEADAAVDIPDLVGAFADGVETLGPRWFDMVVPDPCGFAGTAFFAFFVGGVEPDAEGPADRSPTWRQKWFCSASFGPMAVSSWRKIAGKPSGELISNAPYQMRCWKSATVVCSTSRKIPASVRSTKKRT